MRAREHRRFARDLADVRGLTTVDTRAAFDQHHFAADVVFQILDQSFEFFFAFGFEFVVGDRRDELGFRFVLRLGVGLVPRVLLALGERRRDQRSQERLHRRREIGVDGRGRELALGLGARLRAQLVDHVEHGLHRVVTELESGQDIRFRNEFGFALDHQQTVAGARDRDVDVRSLKLRAGRIGFELAAQARHDHRGGRTVERNVADVQRRRSADARQNVDRERAVERQRGRHDLRFETVAFREARTNRAIDQTRRQRRVVGRAAFALEVAARNLTGGVEFFGVLHRQREEVDVFGVTRRDGRDQHHVVAARNQNRTVGLFREATGFEGDRAVAHFSGNCDFIHVGSFVIYCRLFS